MKMVTELLSASVETETEIVDHDVIIEQIPRGILPSMTHMESLI